MGKKETLNSWLYEHSWAMIVFFISAVIAFSLLKYRVDINTQIIYALQDKVNVYPSEQYFNERFKNLEKSLDEVKTDLKVHMAQ